MRIVHFSTQLSHTAGGLYHSVSGLAKAQAALGADVTVAGTADAYFEADRHIWGALPVLAFPQRFGRYGFDPQIPAALRRLKPDILHVHGLWSAASIYGAVTATRACVVSPRGMLDPWIIARKPIAKAIHSAMFERPMLRRAHVHALNENERRATQAFMPSLQERVFVLSNGIDESFLAPNPVDRHGALYLGRIHEKKQVLKLIEAWSQHPAAPALSIAGWGEKAHAQRVIAAAASIDNVHVVGPLHGEAKAKAFEQSRFFFLPSLSEGMPMAVLEALRHGCIPVLTDACNLPELFADDIAFRMKADFSDFQPLLARLLSLPEAELQRRSANARRYAGRYAWPRIADQMLRHYERILGGKGIDT